MLTSAVSQPTAEAADVTAKQQRGAAGRRHSASSCLPSPSKETSGSQVDLEPSCDEDTAVVFGPANSTKANVKGTVSGTEPSPAASLTKGELARLRLELQSVRVDKCLRTRSYNPSAAKWKATRPHVRLQYQDEGLRTRFCANAQGLLDAVLKDPQASTKSARIARKALCYRNVLHRLGDVDPKDPAFDISSFFGVKWCKRTAISAE